jgi:hypothetical protein
MRRQDRRVFRPRPGANNTLVFAADDGKLEVVTKMLDESPDQLNAVDDLQTCSARPSWERL